VRVADSLDEPVLNGLFIITVDHDEARYKGKPQAKRHEEVQDLLAFAKVYFFGFRDFLRGIDQAREAEQIGDLNQELYDRRLAELSEAMRLREESEPFQADGIAHAHNWDLFLYELCNGYARSLMEKKPEVAIETFGYERLFLVPLASQGGGSQYDLPLHLYQSLYLERDEGAVLGGHFSLLKPFRSPVESIDDEEKDEADRFKERSFRHPPADASLKASRRRHLEKCYVGQEPATHRPGDEARSFLPKRADPAGTDLEASPADRGKEWMGGVLRAFWKRLGTDPGEGRRWLRFLESLTDDYRWSCAEGEYADGERGRHHWLWFRFALLRALLQAGGSEAEAAFSSVRQKYAEAIRLRFDNRSELNILALAGAGPAALFVQIEKALEKLHQESRSALDRIVFERWVPVADASGEETLEFSLLRLMTGAVANDDAVVGAMGGETWYQPQLTRVRPAKDADNKSAHAWAGSLIKKRRPQYDRMLGGEDGVYFQLALVHFTVGATEQGLGRSDRDKQRVSLVAAVVRDFDPLRPPRAGTDSAADAAALRAFQEREEQRMAKDREDLTLFTKTVFQNADKFVTNAVRQQHLRVLTTDVNQIARNWYSAGIDSVVDRLQAKLRALSVLGDEKFKLDRFHPALMEAFVEAMLAVLIKKEKRGSKDILLESFPFDRLMHIPLMPRRWQASRLCYVRTDVREADVRDAGGPGWPGGVASYEQIRRLGRVWPRHGGEKALAFDLVRLAPAGGGPEASFEPPGPLDGSARAERVSQVLERREAGGLREALDGLARAETLPALVRLLYTMNELEALALAGAIRHLLNGSQHRDASARLKVVIEDRIRALEQPLGDVPPAVFTEAHLARRVALTPTLDTAGRWAGEAQAEDADASPRELPLFRELFRALEKGEEWEYGLAAATGPEAYPDSKAFYVYYSLAIPEAFAEDLGDEPRYRGLFLLTVDDADTDTKNETSLLADREDIHTFVHSGVGGLRLVLDQQALQSELLQPGIEQFFTGMLHRLKNELNLPSSVLSLARKELGRAAESSAHANGPPPRAGADLLGLIDNARAQMVKFGDLFKILKELAESERDEVPLQALDSSWLGWQFVAWAAAAPAKEMERAKLDWPDEHLEARKGLEELAARAEAQLHADSWQDADAVPGCLAAAAKWAQALLPPRAELNFTFQTRDDRPIPFLGSHLLIEALRILFENAFHEMWKHAHRTGKGRLSLVCRKQEDRRGEVFLDFRNSTLPINDLILKALGAKVPTPIPEKVHAEGSGKQGGSGFGHYYARRVISKFCGGRANRRRLDVEMIYDKNESPNDCLMRVNLVEDASPGLVPLTLGRILAEAKAGFSGAEPAAAPHAAEGEREFLFPGKGSVSELARVVRSLLEADREARVAEVLSELEDYYFGELKDVSETWKRKCGEAARTLGQPVPGGLEESLTDTETPCQVLNWLAALHEQDKEKAEALLSQEQFGDGLRGPARKVLESLSGDKKKQWSDLVADEQMTVFADRLRKYDALLAEPVSENGGLAVFSCLREENGALAPDRRELEKQLKKPQWSWAASLDGGGLHLAFRLADGAGADLTDAGRASGGTVISRPELLTKFKEKLLGRTFVQYQDQNRMPDALLLQRGGDGGASSCRTVHLTLRPAPAAAGPAEGGSP
jgi:hypothetical protein